MKTTVSNATRTSGWRQKPLARAVALASTALFAHSLQAAPPAQLPLPRSALPVQAQNWLVHGNAQVNTVGNTMTIDQATAKAILDWKSFNVGQDAKVQFNQPSVTSTTLNRINDQSFSQILGQISANGNVYLVNNNGILFGERAKINVHGLVASTLNIDANQYINSSLPNAINEGKAALDGGSSEYAAIIVMPGASISTDEGGQVILAGRAVINGGTISTPGGQTILAASKDKVYLAVSDNNSDLRGLLVEVDTGGSVTNVGKIIAERGNITLLGLAVNQSGALRATTSVDVNGSIRLIARDKAKLENNEAVIQQSLLAEDKNRLPTGGTQAVAQEGGTLTLGAGSVTEVVPVDAKTDPGASSGQAQPTPRIDLVGKTIELQDNSTVRAKGGRVNVVATATPSNLDDKSVAKNDSRIHVGSNATIDVSGEKTELEMSSRIVAVELRGDELKDSPLQRNGFLHGKTVYVDIDRGTPLVSDLSPTLAKVKHSVTERLAAGGTINMKSQGDVVMGDQAHLNISGGAVSYKSGTVYTTKLLSDGRVVDIGAADPNRKYDGIFGEYDYDHPKWGKTVYRSRSFASYREGFTEGKAGGTLSIDTQTMYGFDRVDLVAGANTGVFQRAGATLPARGKVAIALGQGPTLAANSVQDVLIRNFAASALLGVDGEYFTAPDKSAVAPLIISADRLNRSGVGRFSLSANGVVRQDADTSIRLQPGAGISLAGTGIEIAGRIGIPGGSIVLSARAPNDGDAHLEDRYDATLLAGSWLDTSGSWVNDLLDGLKGGSDVAASVVNGGSISVQARNDLTFSAGAVLRSDAGAQLTSSGGRVQGKGGTISLASQQAGSKLKLEGVLSAFGFAGGGTLNVTAPQVDIGARTMFYDPDSLWLGTDFFTSSGFGQYNVTASAGDLIVHSDANLQLSQQNLQFSDLWKVARQATGSNIRAFADVATLPDYQRKAAAVKFTTAADSNGDLQVETGARIATDAKGTVALNSARNLFVDGSITARGGDIDLRIDASQGAEQSVDLTRMLWLGSNATLDASATRVARFNALGLNDGIISDGGSINLQADRGALVTAPGSKIDVSGGSYRQDYVTVGSIQQGTVNAAAGSVSLSAANGIAAFGTMKGMAAGSDGIGGSLTYNLDATRRRIVLGDSSAEFNPRTISVVDSLPAWDGSVKYGEALPDSLAFKAVVAADTAANGGFSNLTLRADNLPISGTLVGGFGSISFDSDVRLAVRDTLTLGATNIAVNDHKVELRAPIIQIGQQLTSEAAATTASQTIDTPVAGTGELSLYSRFMELVGNIGVGGAQRVALNSTNDIRLRAPANTDFRFSPSTFSTTGDLALQASQVYGATLTDYTFALQGDDSTFSVRSSGAARTPVLSAASKLTVSAPHIDIAAALLAPLGTIALNATKDVRLRDGALLDVSANNQLIPFGRIQGGDILWSYFINPTRSPLLIDKVPEKTVTITGPVVSMDKGSQIDVSGGGDVYGIEQIPGTGGSRDFLDPANSNGAFAVVPWLNSSVSPYDVVEMAGFQIDGKGPRIGDIIYLDSAAGLPAGNYAILPAHYALLQGAYLVTPKSTTWQPGQSAKQIDGTTWVAGRYGRAFTGSFDAQWQGFLIEPGSAARTRSEYNIITSTQFFAEKPNAGNTGDAGRVGIEVDDQLDLLGFIRGAAAQNGRRAQLDIIANEIEVVSERDPGSTAVQLRASDLNGVGVDSVLLGGWRSGNRDEVAIAVGSNSVRVREGAMLSVPDVLLAATDRVTLDKGSVIAATGASTSGAQVFKIDGDGAFLRASSAEQANISRTNSTGTAGTIVIGDGAKVVADYSILIDSSKDMELEGDLILNARKVGITSLNLTANRINLGDGSDAAADGVRFDNAKLNSFNAQSLRLSSRSTIDFYGDVALKNQIVELNAGELRATQTGEVKLIAADTLKLDNTLNADLNADNLQLFDPGAPDDRIAGAKLVLAAKNLVLGNDKDAFGDQIEDIQEHRIKLGGFEQVELGAAGLTAQVVGEGKLTLFSSADIDVIADRVGGNRGATTSIQVRPDTGSINLRQAGAGAFSVATALSDTAGRLGARLTLTAKSIAQGTHIDLPSGVLTMQATGSASDDNVALLAGSVTDVSGRQLVFPQGSTVATDGGEVHLGSVAGDVVGASGAKVVLGGSGSFDGATLAPTTSTTGKVTLAGNSGLLDIVAKGRALWQSGIQALAGNDASGKPAAGGSLQLDVGGFDAGEFGGWLQTIADGGINKRISIRSRNGDLNIDRQIKAGDVTLSADSGDVTLAAAIDARGAGGGHVALWGGNDLNIADGARIDASATAAGGRGGRVELGARDGTLTFGANTALNVAGHAGDANHDAGRDGSVLLRAPRTATNDDVSIANNGVNIDGAMRIELEAFKSYESLDGTVSSVINDAFSDAQQFMTDTAVQDALRARFADAAPAGVFHVTPGIDIYSTRDLTLDTNLSLSARRYGAIANVFDGEAGVLGLRAAGNLTIAGDLTDGTANLQTLTANTRLRSYLTKSLRRDFSWDYRLAGGADLAAADPTAVQRLTGSGTGNLIVTGGKDIITGAGWIGLYAGNAVDVQEANSVLAILGRTDFAQYVNPTSTTGAIDTLPDTGSIDPYFLTALAVKNPTTGSTLNVGTQYLFYPKDGGDLTVSARDNVQFAASSTFFTDWMLRIANNETWFGTSSSTQKIPFKSLDFTSWGIGTNSLTQGVVVLGGGNATVQAGRDVVNLNIALPTTARQTGINGANAISIIGGGNLVVQAGNDILSPRLWVDRGRLEATAGGRFGAIEGGAQSLLAVADTDVDIRARGDVELGAVVNSTVMPISKKAFTSNFALLENYFFTYSDDASIDVTSLQGDVILANDYASTGNNIADGGLADNWVRRLEGEELRIFAVYPGQVSALAVNRNIRIENNMTLFPSSKGQLQFLAGNDIAMGSDATQASVAKVNLSDVDPANLPTFDHPTKVLFNTATGADSAIARLIGEVSGLNNPFWHAAMPLHASDKNPAVVAALGDIGVDGLLTFELAKPLRAYAGNDIRNITFSLQHGNAAQISEIVAGRDVAFPLVAEGSSGSVLQDGNQFIRVSGPGRLDVIAGRDIDLGSSGGIEASANLHNGALPEQGASLNVLAGVGGASALSDPILYNQFADRYFGAANTLSGSYIDWFSGGAFTQSTARTGVNRINLVGAFTGKKYADDASALADYKTLPVLVQQAIALEAYQDMLIPDSSFQSPTDLATLQALGGNLGAALKKVTGKDYTTDQYGDALGGLSAPQRQQVARTLQDASSYTARLIDYVSLEDFGGDLTAAVSAATGQSYASNTQAAVALAKLSAAEQQRVARNAIDAASTTVRRGLLLDVYVSTIRDGGTQQAYAKADGVTLQSSEGNNRGYAAIEQMFPGDKWKGDMKLALSGVRTYGDGDINIIAPGGDVDVGLANQIAGIDKKPDQLGIITNGFGDINGIARGSFNINQSRIFSLGNGDITLWSSFGNIDAGKGAKTALSVQPPKIVFAADGSSKLVYSTPVAGSGIQGGGPERDATDRGSLLPTDDQQLATKDDTRRSRIRYVRSLSQNTTYLFTPQGVVNSGDAGIAVVRIVTPSPIQGGNVTTKSDSVGFGGSTAISAGTLSLGNSAATATDNAANATSSAASNAAAAAAAASVAFVTVDIIGVGQ